MSFNISSTVNINNRIYSKCVDLIIQIENSLKTSNNYQNRLKLIKRNIGNAMYQEDFKGDRIEQLKKCRNELINLNKITI
jgi:hypothetical protein